jgi:hypothetical protein
VNCWSAILLPPPFGWHASFWRALCIALGLCDSVGAEVYDDSGADQIDRGKWDRPGPLVFTQSDGRLRFPCQDAASETLVSTRTFPPGFFQLSFENYRSSNMSPGGRGLGSYLAIGLAGGDERVRVIRGDIRSGGYFEANHFKNGTYNLWYHDTNVHSGRLGLYFDGTSVRAFHGSGLRHDPGWQSVGPAISPNWSSPPKLYIGGNAGGSGCTTFAVTSVEFVAEPLPAALRQELEK